MSIAAKRFNEFSRRMIFPCGVRPSEARSMIGLYEEAHPTHECKVIPFDEVRMRAIAAGKSELRIRIELFDADRSW